MHICSLSCQHSYCADRGHRCDVQTGITLGRGGQMQIPRQQAQWVPGSALLSEVLISVDVVGHDLDAALVLPQAIVFHLKYSVLA